MFLPDKFRVIPALLSARLMSKQAETCTPAEQPGGVLPLLVVRESFRIDTFPSVLVIGSISPGPAGVCSRRQKQIFRFSSERSLPGAAVHHIASAMDTFLLSTQQLIKLSKIFCYMLKTLLKFHFCLFVHLLKVSFDVRVSFVLVRNSIIVSHYKL